MNAPSPAERAGTQALARVPRAAPETTAGAAVAGLGGAEFEAASELAVLDGERLVGVVPIERLLAAAAGVRLGALAEEPCVVGPEEELEVAARSAARTGRRVVAVVGADGDFVGFVPPARLLRVLELEHEEDMARLGGFLSRARVARVAAEEGLRRRLWHRLPWLALGLAGAMASTLVVGWFEDALRRQVLLALFVPAVVYMADAVGTQTETLVIRGMAAGIPIRSVLGRELATGAVVGVLVAAAFFPFALAVWGDARVAAAVALSLLVSCAVATLVAMALPYVLDVGGRDPAFGSGPLATVLQDLLSILAYFSIANAIAF